LPYAEVRDTPRKVFTRLPPAILSRCYGTFMTLCWYLKRKSEMSQTLARLDIYFLPSDYLEMVAEWLYTLFPFPR